MSVIQSELQARQAVNMPEDDTGLTGGAINANGLVELTQLAVNDTIRVSSSNAGDTTQTVTIDGRLASGVRDTEVLNLNGTTVVSGTKTFERILKTTLSASAAGTVTVARNTTPFTTIVAIPTTVTSVVTLFIDSASDVAQVIRYMKVFLRNTNATTALTTAVTRLTADPATSIRIANAAAKGDSTTIANRLAVPGGVTFVDDGVDQSVPTGNLGASENIGVWIEMTRGASAAAVKSTFTVRLAGNTT